MAPRKKAKTNSDPLGKVPDGRCRISRLSELFQMSERGVRLLAQKRIIPKPSEGLWAFDACLKGYIGYLRQFSRGRRPDDPTSVDDRVRLLKAKADIQEMEAQRMADRLLEIDVVEETWIDVVAAMRARLLAIPTRAGTLLAGEKDPDRIHEQVSELIHEALYELSTAEIVAVDENGAHDRSAYGHTGAA